MKAAARNPRKTKTPAALPAEVPNLPVRRFTVDEYHRLIEAGILIGGEPYELIRGWIVQKKKKNPPHCYALTTLCELLWSLRIAHAAVRCQQPVTTDDSEPEPDLLIAAGSTKVFLKRNPTPREVHFLIEVSDSSLSYDQTTKLELYAQSKIAVYWIVNLIDRRVEVYTEPRGGKKPGYKQQTNYDPGEEVSVLIGGKEVGRIAVNDLLEPI